MGKRELIALLNLSSWCLVMVERLFLTVPRGCLQFVIVVFPDHTHLLFLFRVLEIKLNLVKLTFRTAISSHQVMGILSKKCEVWKIYHTEYGLFLATDWLKSEGSGRVMG